jgi:hypothetical protein
MRAFVGESVTLGAVSLAILARYCFPDKAVEERKKLSYSLADMSWTRSYEPNYQGRLIPDSGVVIPAVASRG